MDNFRPGMNKTTRDGQNLLPARPKPYFSFVPSLEPGRQKTFFRYLTWSEEDEKWQLVCTDAGYTEVRPFTRYPPHKESHPKAFKSVAVGRSLSEYQLIYVTRGRGIFESNGHTRVVVPGSILVVFPGIRHFYRPEYEVGWTEYWVGFRGPYADTLRGNGFLSPEKPLYEVGLQNRLLSIYTQIFDLVGTQRLLYQVRASSLVLTLIAEVLAHERKVVQYDHSEQLVEKARFLMEENLCGEIDLHGMAETLGVSAAHLTAVFKSYTSMTPYQFYISIKIRRAKEMLESGDLSIKEVAFRLGFSDQYYFSRLFRKKVGLPPSRWSSFVRE